MIVDLLVSHRTALSRVGIEASDSEPGAREPEAGAQIAVDDPRRLDDEVLAERLRHFGQRDMDGDRRDGQRLRPDHHDRKSGARPRSWRVRPEIPYDPGKRNPASYSTALAIGFVTTARATPVRTEFDGSGDRLDRRAGGAGVRSARLRTQPDFRAERPAGPGRKSDAVRPDSVSMIGASTPKRFDRLLSRPGGARTKNGASPRALARHAESASSGPIPAGSPIVIARGGLSPVMQSAPALVSLKRSKADVPLDVADGAQDELEHQRSGCARPDCR